MKLFILMASIITLTGCGGGSSKTDTVSSTPAPAESTGKTAAATNTSSKCVDVDPANVLAGKQYTRCDGSVGTGTLPLCASDGETGCLTSTVYPAADTVTTAVPGNIKVGVSIANVAGAFNGSYSTCQNDGDVGCLATASNPSVVKSAIDYTMIYNQTIAGSSGTLSSCSANGSNCYLPSYVVTTQPLKAISYDYVNTNKAGIRNSLTVGGVAGAMNDCSGDNGVGCYTLAAYPSVNKSGIDYTKIYNQTIAGSAGTLSSCSANGSNCYLPSYVVTTQPLKAISYDYVNGNAAGIRSSLSIGGVSGTMSDCSSDNGVGCYTITNYPSVVKANVDTNKMLTNLTVAGISGSIASKGSWDLTTTFPGTGYYTGVSSAPTASLLSTAQIAGTAGAINNCSGDNGVGCYTVTNYPSVNKLAIDYTKIYTSQTIAGTSGSLGACSANGSNCYLAVYASGSQSLKAIDYDNINANKSLIETSLTIAGVQGTLGGCSFQGAQTCVASGSYYAATACAGNDSNCYVPAYFTVAQPLKAISYDYVNTNTSGIRSSLTIGGVAGTMSDCSSDNGVGCYTLTNFPSVVKANVDTNKMLTTLTVAGISGSIASKGSWDLTTTFPGTGYYTGVSSAPTASLLSTAQIAGTVGAINNCNADNGVGCYTLTNYPSVVKANVDTNKMLTTLTVAGIAGSIASEGSWNLTTAFPGAGYYTGVSGAPTASLLATAQIAGTAGSIQSCNGNDQTNCLTSNTWPSADLTNAVPGNIANGVEIGGVTGNKMPIQQCRNATYLSTWDTSGPSNIPMQFDSKNGVSSNIINLSSPHGLTTAFPIQFTKQGANPLPTGLSTGTTYYAIISDSTHIKVASSASNASGGVAITLTATGTSYWPSVVPAPDSLVGLWDTLDDYNNGNAASPNVSFWGGSAYICNESNFTNVTGGTHLNPSNTTPTKADQSWTQIWEDNLTGMYFTNVLYDGSGA